MSGMAPASVVPVTSVVSVAEPAGQVPGEDRPGRTSRRRVFAVARFLRWRTRPERIRGMAAAAVLAAILLGLIAAVIFAGLASGMRLIGQQAEPEVLATTDLYFRLNVRPRLAEYR